jgi:L-iditol 2-dehydrogenase
VAAEAVGVDETVRTAIDCVRKGGRVTLVGNVSPEVTLPLQKVVTRQIRLQGSCASAGEYPQAIEYVASGKIQVKPLITAVAPLEQGPRWFERLYSREPNLMKVVLTPGEGLLVDGGISTGATKALVQQETVQQKTIQQK